MHGTKSLTLGDAVAIKNQIPLIKAVSPNLDGSIQIVYRNQNWFTNYRGVSPEFFDIKRWDVTSGALFSADDVDRAADVLRDRPDGAGSTLSPTKIRSGRSIRSHGPAVQWWSRSSRRRASRCRVKDQDDVVIMPYTTVMKKIRGVTWLDDIMCSAVSSSAIKLAGQQARALLRDRHRLRPEQDDDFNVRNPEDIIQAQLEASRTLTLLLATIASISLIVGGIGIMNVMLVSVTERTREIGVRVAVGATEVAIQLQFLGESVLLSLVGGAAGVCLGIAVSMIGGRALGWAMQLSVEAVILAALFSIAVGVFFGYYPARKAALLDPIDALRYE